MPPQTRPGLVVDIGDTQGHLTGLDRGRLAEVARRVLEAEGIARAEISIAVVDDPTIHELNRRHLDHDEPTDVISFVLSDPGDECLSGELIVSAETAVRMARLDGIEPRTELTLYIVHGLLHLCGYDDLTGPAAAAMRRREAELLAAVGLEHPFSPTAISPSQPVDPPSGSAPERTPWRS
jgi:probable rRNA maturation factor